MEGKEALLRALEERGEGVYLLSGSDARAVEEAEQAAVAFLLCEAEEGRPCGVCAGCRLRQTNAHPDLCTLLPEEGKKTIGVDAVRALIGEVYSEPVRRKGRVVRLPQGAALTVPAQNALLKTLEEPPEGTVFLVCGPEAAFLPTVRSRAMPVRISAGAGAPAVQEAEGYAALVPVLKGKEPDRAALPKDRAGLERALEGFAWFLRDALACRLGKTPLFDGGAAEFARLGEGALLGCLAAANEARQQVLANANGSLAVDRLCILCARALHNGGER